MQKTLAMIRFWDKLRNREEKNLIYYITIELESRRPNLWLIKRYWNKLLSF